MKELANKLASLEATLVRNYDPLTDRLTGVKCRATSVAKKRKRNPSRNNSFTCWLLGTDLESFDVDKNNQDA